jgi:hypothetical protein
VADLKTCARCAQPIGGTYWADVPSLGNLCCACHDQLQAAGGISGTRRRTDGVELTEAAAGSAPERDLSGEPWATMAEGFARAKADTCRRCSEPAAVQLPAGGRLCSGCAAERIVELERHRHESGAIAIVEWSSDLLAAKGADNYVEFGLSRGDEAFRVLVQRRDGKTPAMLRDEAIAERDEARARNKTCRRMFGETRRRVAKQIGLTTSASWGNIEDAAREARAELERLRNAERLVAAIRAFTADREDGEGNSIPNGPAEEAFADLGAALWAGDLNATAAAASAAVFALADDTRELRQAAEDYFGGDFRAPDDGGTGG